MLQHTLCNTPKTIDLGICFVVLHKIFFMIILLIYFFLFINEIDYKKYIFIRTKKYLM